MSHVPSQTPRSNTPAPISPCDLFSEDVHLLVDGELGVAETAVVEEHLHACPHCLALAARLEAMSSMLKDWDTRTNDIPAPALRINRAVLTRVREHSALRRRESRLVGLLHYASAALVLLALGLGIGLGLRHEGSAPKAVAFEVLPAAWPLERAGERTPVFAAHVTAASLSGWRLAVDPSPIVWPRLTSLGSEPDWDRLGEWQQVWSDEGGHRRVAFLSERVRRQQAFAERVGAPTTVWSGPRLDEPGQRLLTVRALNYLHDRGHLEEWKLAAPTPREAASPTVVANAVPAIRQATDMTAADMLSPMPGVDRELKNLFRQGRLSTLGMAVGPGRSAPGRKSGEAARSPISSLLEAWPLSLVDAGLSGGLTSGAMRRAPLRFLDPLKAEANRMLRLREEDDGEGSVVFIVEGTTEPILIPAGQFIDGGFGARVVAETVWLPASKGETPCIVRCRMVENAALGEPKGHPTLVPHVAGPTIRGLLAAGASQAQIRSVAKRIFALRQHAGYDLFDGWNLLEVYGSAAGRRYDEIFRGKLAWKKGRGGFVVRDSDGRLVGLEVLRFQGPAAEALLARLWTGYVVEAVLRHGRLHPLDPAQARKKSEVEGALAPSSDELTRAIHRMANHPAVFRMPLGFDASRGWRVSGLEIVAAGLHMHALEVGGDPVYVSTTTSLPR